MIANISRLLSDVAFWEIHARGKSFPSDKFELLFFKKETFGTHTGAIKKLPTRNLFDVHGYESGVSKSNYFLIVVYSPG